ncbi:hypothetical protein OBJ95_12740 [Empedobacter falsenii]
MVDFLKLISNSKDIIDKILNRKDLEKIEQKVNVIEVFEIKKYKLRFEFRKAWENNQHIGYSSVEIRLKPHYVFNNHLHNANDFNPSDCICVINEVFSFLSIQQNEFKEFYVINIEIGLNMIINRDVESFMNGVIYYKKSPFKINKNINSKISDTSERKQIKIYAKGLQFQDLKEININTIRYEIKSKKSNYIKKTLGIETLDKLLLTKTYSNVFSELIKELKYILIIDINPNLKGQGKENRNYLTKTSKVNYWKGLTDEKYKSQFDYERKKYNRITSIKDEFDTLVLNTLMRLHNSEFLPKDYALNNFIKT